MTSYRKKKFTEEFEWISGEDFVNSAHLLMGGIDLDPASSHVANQYVGADKYYTPEDDGLNEQDWFGNVYLFPPSYTYYWDMKSQRWKRTKGMAHTLVSGHALWWRTLKRKWLSGEVRQGLYFSNSPDMVRYCQDIFDFPVCFLKNTPMLRRHYFADGKIMPKNTCTSFIVYLQPSDGAEDYTQNFFDIYSEKGRIIA